MSTALALVRERRRETLALASLSLREGLCGGGGRKGGREGYEIREENTLYKNQVKQLITQYTSLQTRFCSMRGARGEYSNLPTTSTAHMHAPVRLLLQQGLVFLRRLSIILRPTFAHQLVRRVALLAAAAPVVAAAGLAQGFRKHFPPLRRLPLRRSGGRDAAAPATSDGGPVPTSLAQAEADASRGRVEETQHDEEGGEEGGAGGGGVHDETQEFFSG